MAQTPTIRTLPLNLFMYSTFLLISFPSLTRSLHPKQQQKEHQFQALHVSASIRKTFQVFAKTPPAQKAHFAAAGINASKNSSSMSLSLHPRTSILKPPHHNYSTLTLSRLAFDSTRVNSINYKLQLSLYNRTVPRIRSPVTSGQRQGTTEYLVRVGVGRPVKEYYMIVDTGSDVNWLQCKPCDYCYQQSDPIFDPSLSSTFSPLSCTSLQCNSLRVNGCRHGRCRFYMWYGDGSYTYGDFVAEMITFTGSGAVVHNVAIGCGHDNEGLFYGSAGIIGLGTGVLSFPSQIKATSFSYCLVDMDSHSSSTLEFNSAPLGDTMIVPMVRNPKSEAFFYIELIGISVGGEQLPISSSMFKIDNDGSGGVIVDSGTVVTRLVTPAYFLLRDTFVKCTPHLPSTSGYYLFDTCYDFSGIAGGIKVPTVSFHFSGGKTLSFKSRNCLVPVDSHGKFCFAFAPTDSVSILGNIQQQGIRINYDLVNKQIGFSPNKC